jgi:hypothetical protein
MVRRFLRATSKQPQPDPLGIQLVQLSHPICDPAEIAYRRAEALGSARAALTGRSALRAWL